VDVGRFKSEFLADYWQRHGTPLDARALGHVRSLLRFGSAAPSLFNAVARSKAGRWIAETAIGIDRRRSMPALAPRTFEHAARQRAASATAAPSAVLFGDTFTNYCHPDIGLAALDVMAAAGVHANVVSHACCGRPLISKGLLDEARLLAEANTRALFDAAASGQPIVFLEPSCLSAVQEDAPALLRGDLQRAARTVANACLSFEAFIERGYQTKTIDLRLAAGPRTIVLHGHCHQKAAGLLAPVQALLSRIPDATVVDLDAGCCGMAGSFGYDRAHYEVSKAIGERRLLPAARALGPGDILVAPGTSCREQVAHFTGVQAVHPAVLLRSLSASARANTSRS
jgi:Fe-S oxidoreductase